MAEYDPLDADADPFRPPAIPTLVFCLHCGQEYDSYRIEWRILTDTEGQPHGFWCCPTPDCGGMGFGFDILPVDRSYRDERGGWVDTDDEEFDEAEEEEPRADGAGPGAEADPRRRSANDDDDVIPW